DVVVVTGAAAEISCHAGAYLVRARLRNARQESFRAHELTLRAEAALRSIVIDKGLLQRIEAPILRKTFHCFDGPAIRPHGKVAARVHRLAVEQYRAGPTFASVAADLGPRQAEVIAEKLDQRPAVFDLDAPIGSIDRNPYHRSRNRIRANTSRWRLCFDFRRCRRNRERRP